MSDIPLARDLLVALAGGMQASHPTEAATILSIVQEHMYRDYLKPRAPRKSVQMNAALAATIRAHAKRRPNLSAQEIATIYGVNQGRVSEAIAGKW